MITINIIDSASTFPVRHAVLRQGKPLSSCAFDGDDLATTKHFGLYKEEELMAIVSVFEKQNNLFNQKKQYQIRGMAVLEHAQGYGFGKLLIKKVEEYCKANECNLIWFNARASAVGFYENLGYQIHGTSFEIAEIGTHFVMFKSNLTSS